MNAKLSPRWLVRIFCIWTLFVWTVLIKNMITAGDQTIAFRVVHIGLAAISIGLAVAVWPLAKHLSSTTTAIAPLARYRRSDRYIESKRQTTTAAAALHKFTYINNHDVETPCFELTPDSRGAVGHHDVVADDHAVAAKRQCLFVFKKERFGDKVTNERLALLVEGHAGHQGAPVIDWRECQV